MSGDTNLRSKYKQPPSYRPNSNEPFKVAGLSRRTEKLEELAKTLEGLRGRFHPIRCDVAREENVLKAFKSIGDNLGAVHVLVNNAGLARHTTLTSKEVSRLGSPRSLMAAGGSTESWRRVFDVNVMALCICTREAVRSMRQNGVEGHVVHINSAVPSGGGLGAGLNVYPASKFAVAALAETLIQELKSEGSRIKVTVREVVGRMVWVVVLMERCIWV